LNFPCYSGGKEDLIFHDFIFWDGVFGEMHVQVLILLGFILFLSQVWGLEEKSLYQAGGWGLIVGGSSNCPPGTRSHTSITVTVCCPTNYVSPDSQGIGGRVCCPPGMLNLIYKGINCLENLQATPYCADSTWALWNQTLGVQGSFFCCLSGQQGEQSSSAVACTSGAIDFGTNAAQSVSISSSYTVHSTRRHTNRNSQVVQQPPSGSSASTISVSPGTQTISSTTKSSTSSSILYLVTFRSDSKKIEPRPFNIPMLEVVRWGFTTLALIQGFALVLGT
jgi:hypothetical protein